MPPAKPRAEADPAAELPQLSEGERLDLLNAGTTVSPFTGKVLVASDYGLEPLNDEAKARQAKAIKDRAAGTSGISTGSADA